MKRIFGYIFTSLIWLEAVYHIGIYGFCGVQPLLMITFAVFLAGIETILVGVTKKRGINLGIFWGVQIFNYMLFAVQFVYHNIFTQPLLLEIAFVTGLDAITDFWSVALDGIVRSLIPLMIMLIPILVMAVLLKKKILVVEQYQKKDVLTNFCVILAGIVTTTMIFVASYFSKGEFYSQYQEFYAANDLIRDYGVLPVYGRQLMFDLLPEKAVDVQAWQETFASTEGTEEMGTEVATESEEVVLEPEIDTSPNVLNIDFDALMANGNGNIDKMANIMQSMTPSKRNEYTGMMEGYNLIYITAEAFSPYAINPELTPTLYRMVNSGVVVKDYYVPMWATSTSDGEYVNLMGQIPDGQHSFRRSQHNNYPYSLPAYFAAEGVKSYAYHNNSLTYYDRYLTHPNLGYDFKAALRGGLSAEQWGSQVFEMEGSKKWPSSDYNMMVATVPEWIDDERFYAYYMSLSGHCNYSWSGNSMSAQNRDLVANLNCSEQMKAYIACNYELEKAVAYLVEQLTLAGKLDKTLIVISADHHPYGLNNIEAELEAFTGTQMSDLDIQKNCLIMWNSQMKTVNVEKTCSSIDIMPTIMNLMGFEYDSRLFAGRDILSDSPSMVVFMNRSFITDKVIYNASTKEIISRNGAEISDEYISAMKSYVRAMFQLSAGMLNYGFEEAVYHAQVKPPVVEE